MYNSTKNINIFLFIRNHIEALAKRYCEMSFQDDDKTKQIYFANTAARLQRASEQIATCLANLSEIKHTEEKEFFSPYEDIAF